MFLRAAVLAAAIAVSAPAALSQAPVTVFDGARILDGNGGAPLENGRLVVQGDRILAIGAMSAVTAPTGSTRIDLSGKTIMPAMINVHSHMGFEGYTTWHAKNHTAANLLDHLQREAYYGVAAVTSVGTSPTELSLQFQRDQRAGKYPSRLDICSCRAWRRRTAVRTISSAKRRMKFVSSTK